MKPVSGIAGGVDTRTTLTRFIIEEQRRVIGATGDFTSLLNDIATACKIISHAVSRGALHAAPQPAEPAPPCARCGELALPLSGIAGEVMRSSNLHGGHLAAMASAEREDIEGIPAGLPRGKYLLLFDALDGVSNCDINNSVGSIFSILMSPRPGGEASAADFLQPGSAQVCAGFALYGPSTVMVLSTGNGVDGFTLDRDIGEFVLTHPHMSVPAHSSEFAINAANERFWEAPVKRYISECLAGKTGPRGRDFSMRWVASLVAETYRILTRGGIFMYPLDDKNRDAGGRLQLLCEANPLAFIIEQAGGAATTGRHARILDLQPAALHQRVPLMFGSREEIERIVGYHAAYHAGREEGEFSSPLFTERSLFRSL